MRCWHQLSLSWKDFQKVTLLKKPAEVLSAQIFRFTILEDIYDEKNRLKSQTIKKTD